MHPDLKSANILINTQEKRIVIYELGMSYFGNSKDSYMRETQNHMSPEMIDGDVYGLQPDIWSVGCIFFALLTNGRRLFGGKDISATFGETANYVRQVEKKKK
eukprot:GHVP01053648.1.p1 GENE.GHVP01053648.1~~GHVP01053648.1.p1  ORF type:complete len:103 (+),score=15.48 GHVP01053648.1:1272-1580(+)